MTVASSIPGSMRFLPRGAPSAPGKLNYFFLTGAYKSGTTWLSMTMNTHPQIFMTGELWLLAHRYGVHSWLNEEAFREWASMPIVRASWMEGVPIEDMMIMAKRGMIEGLMKRHWQPGVRFMGDKTPLFYLKVPEQLHQLFPEAKLINILRDGRDVAVSHGFHMLRSGDREFYGSNEAFDRARAFHVLKQGEPAPLFDEASLAYIARIYAQTVTGSQNARQVFGASYLELRYEDLLQDPYRVREIFTLLGADSSDAVVSACVESNRFERITGRQRGEQDATNFFRKGVAGDWRAHFSEADKAVYKRVAGRELVLAGYAADDSW